MRRISLPLIVVPLLAGCAGNDRLDDRKGVAVEDVLRRVKAEIGLFQNHERAYILEPPLADACKGYVNFYIPKVTMTLSVALTTTTGGTATLGPPLPTDAKLGLSVGGSRQNKQTQTLTFTEFPIEPLPSASDRDDMQELVDHRVPTPMTDSLDGLRNAVLHQSDHGPCLDLRQGDDDPKNSVSFAIDIDDKNNGGLNFAYTMFSLGGTRSAENDNSDRIEISFAPYLNPEPGTDEPKHAAGRRLHKARPSRVGERVAQGTRVAFRDLAYGARVYDVQAVSTAPEPAPAAAPPTGRHVKPPLPPIGRAREGGMTLNKSALSGGTVSHTEAAPAGKRTPRPGPVGPHPERGRPTSGAAVDRVPLPPAASDAR